MSGLITSCILLQFPHNLFSRGVISNVAKPQTRRRVFVLFSSVAFCRLLCTLYSVLCVLYAVYNMYTVGCVVGSVDGISM